MNTVAALFMIAKKLARLINRHMDKKIVHPHTRLLLSNAKEQNTDRLNIDESTYNNTVILSEKKKTDIKNYIGFYFNDILENAEL